MHAFLRRVEVDEAVDLGRDEGVPAAVLHPHCLLDARHAGAREPDPYLRRRRLQVWRGRYSLLHAPTVAREQMPDDKRFAQLVSLACHDLRTPLATVSGFARTLGRTEFEPPVDRYIEIIGDASDQLDELLKELSLLARIEMGRYEPQLVAVDSLEFVRSAAAELEEGRVEVEGTGAEVRVPEEEMRRALSQLARAASRHGGFDSVAYRVEGATLRLSPITPSSADVLLGEALRDLGAVAATTLVRALGGSVEAEAETLVVRLPG